MNLPLPRLSPGWLSEMWRNISVEPRIVESASTPVQHLHKIFTFIIIALPLQYQKDILQRFLMHLQHNLILTFYAEIHNFTPPQLPAMKSRAIMPWDYKKPHNFCCCIVLNCCQQFWKLSLCYQVDNNRDIFENSQIVLSGLKILLLTMRWILFDFVFFLN